MALTNWFPAAPFSDAKPLENEALHLASGSRGTKGGLRPQVTLGISTLLTYVPVSLGAAHQAGALTLFTVVLGLLHSLRRPCARPPAIARVRSWPHTD